MKPTFCAAAVILLVSMGATPLAAAPTIGAFTITPSSIPVSTPTAVTVAAIITDAALIPGSVNLQRMDASTRVFRTIGTLQDDGTQSGRFTGQVPFNESAPFPVTLRVSAAFRGMLTRVFSPSSLLGVTGGAPPIVMITTPGNLSFTNNSPITVSGTVSDPAATVTVNGIAAPAGAGSFAVSLPLIEGNNTITAVAKANGSTETASIQVTLDTVPPRVTIISPPNGLVTTDSTVTVTGSANDTVVGTVNDQQVQVTVNGIGALVKNRSFQAFDVALALGDNVITATGQDRAGNGATTTITVRRVIATQAHIQLLSGNNQSGPIGSQLPSPLVVALLDASGNLVPNQTVAFTTTQNNGTLDGGQATEAVTTNLAGQAQLHWTLGTRSGAGNNTVLATANGFAGSAIFTASGLASAAALINMDAGTDQIGVAGQALPHPFVAVVTDASHNRLANVSVAFQVTQGGGTLNGGPSATLVSDSDGRALVTLTLGPQDGIANNIVEATFPGNAGFAAAFIASGHVLGDPAATRITGVVLDNSNNPVAGVTLRAYLTNVPAQVSQGIPPNISVQSDLQGQFLIQPAPVGFVKLIADGSTAKRPGQWPNLEYDLVTVAGQTNTLGVPIYLLPIDTAHQVCVSDSTGGTLTLPDVPGFSLTVLPGSATFPGGSKTGCFSVTPVHPDKIPMVPGFGQQPRFIVTIQPAGTLFNPPAAITMPNIDGLARREVTEMYSFDHDLGTFVSIGTGTVSDDGTVITSDPGVGVLKAGWFCGGNPAPTGSAGVCPDCQICTGSSCVPDPATEGQACTTASGVPGVCHNGQCVSHAVSITAQAIDQDDPDNTTFLPTNGPVYGGSMARTADNLKLTAETDPSASPTSYTWTVAGPGSYPDPGSSQVWDLGDMSPQPGTLTFKVVVVFADGGTSQATKDIEVGVRTDDIAAIGWIDPANVPLSTAGMDADMLRYYPPAGASTMSVLQKGLTTLHLGVIAAGSTIHPVQIRSMTSSERTYILDWMFEFAGNFCSKNRCPPDSFSSNADLLSFETTRRTSYKLFNRFQIKYLTQGGSFKGSPRPVKQAVEIGVTNNPIYDLEEAGSAGPANNRFSFDSTTAFLINDGTPTFIAVSAFNTLAAPLQWSNIGSRIEEGTALGTGRQIFTQVYPTYWVFDNLSKTQTIPQAPAPIGNFSLTPYPPTPAPFVR